VAVDVEQVLVGGLLVNGHVHLLASFEREGLRVEAQHRLPRDLLVPPVPTRNGCIQ